MVNDLLWHELEAFCNRSDKLQTVPKDLDLADDLVEGRLEVVPNLRQRIGGFIAPGGRRRSQLRPARAEPGPWP